MKMPRGANIQQEALGATKIAEDKVISAMKQSEQSLLATLPHCLFSYSLLVAALSEGRQRGRRSIGRKDALALHTRLPC